MADVIFKQTSTRAFAEAYNYLHATFDKKKNSLNRKRLSEVFYVIQLIQYNKEFNFIDSFESKYFKDLFKIKKYIKMLNKIFSRKRQ